MATTCDQGPTRPDFYRLLNEKEQALARRVFGRTLPPWHEIGIGNGIGYGGRPWTYSGFYTTNAGYSQTPFVKYVINLGSVASEDLTSTRETISILCADFGRICDLFIHEMTHVWQYAQGIAVARRSVGAQCFGGGYEYEVGGSWDDYNVEQQAHIVENWHKKGGSKKDSLYPYIRLVVQTYEPGKDDRNKFAAERDYNDLYDDLLYLRRRGLD